MEDTTVLEVNDAVGVGVETRVVGDAENGGTALAGDVVQEVDDDAAIGSVEGAGGFVGE